MTQRDFLETTGYDPRKETGEGSFIGEGRNKVVWRQNDFAVMNATDDQRRLKDDPTDEDIEESNFYIKKEYNFTVYLHGQLSHIVGIPKVYRYKRDDYFGDNKFRYAKELCEKVEVNDDLLDEMIDLSERLLAAGWVYLDMKPDNLGRINGNLYIVDTDYRSFYRVPPEKVVYFQLWCYFILIMYIYLNHPEITKDKLATVVEKKKLSEKILKDLWKSQVDEKEENVDKRLKPADTLANELIQYGNIQFKDVKEFIQMEGGNQREKDEMTYPFMYYLAYGQTKNKSNLTLDVTDFKKMMTEIGKIKPPPKPRAVKGDRQPSTNSKQPPAQAATNPQIGAIIKQIANSKQAKPRPLAQGARPPGNNAKKRSVSKPPPRVRAASASVADIQPGPNAKPPPNLKPPIPNPKPPIPNPKPPIPNPKPPPPKRRAASASVADIQPGPNATAMTRKNRPFNKGRARLTPRQSLAKKIDRTSKQ